MAEKHSIRSFADDVELLCSAYRSIETLLHHSQNDQAYCLVTVLNDYFDILVDSLESNLLD